MTVLLDPQEGQRRKEDRKRLYRTWKNMIYRCTDPGNVQWKRYGARGIRVCDRWVNSFEAFVEDMAPRPHGMSIDRIDNDGNYEPGNCRWATPVEQARNRSSNEILEFRGEAFTIVEWAEKLGCSKSVIQKRLLAGWPIEDVLGRPVRFKSKQGAGDRRTLAQNQSRLKRERERVAVVSAVLSLKEQGLAIKEIGQRLGFSTCFARDAIRSASKPWYRRAIAAVSEVADA